MRPAEQDVISELGLPLLIAAENTVINPSQPGDAGGKARKFSLSALLTVPMEEITLNPELAVDN